jgi:hypothetical protein
MIQGEMMLARRVHIGKLNNLEANIVNECNSSINPYVSNETNEILVFPEEKTMLHQRLGHNIEEKGF